MQLAVLAGIVHTGWRAAADARHVGGAACRPCICVLSLSSMLRRCVIHACRMGGECIEACALTCAAQVPAHGGCCAGFSCCQQAKANSHSIMTLWQNGSK